jgi:hypothetical protein
MLDVGCSMFGVQRSMFPNPPLPHPNNRILSSTHSAAGSITNTSCNNRFASSKKPRAINASARPHVAKI